MLTQWPGGINPKGQPADLFVSKVTKGHCRNNYETCVLDAPVNLTMGHPIIPSHQLCAIWVVKGWEQDPEVLIKKAWEVGNYAKFEYLQRENTESSNVIVEHTQHSIVEVILEPSDHEAVENVLCEDNVNSDDEFDDRNLFV